MADTNYYVHSDLIVGGVRLDNFGLKVLKAYGLWDFPKPKKNTIDYSDIDYSTVPTRLIDHQFESRQISFDCIVIGESWGDLISKLTSIEAVLNYDGLKMLVCEKYSNKGFIVYMKRMVAVEPSRKFSSGKSVASIKLVFEEPQPFNIQFTVDKRGLPNYSVDLHKRIYLKIENTSSGVLKASNKQQFITVYADNLQTEVNLNASVFTQTITTTITRRLIPVVITGEIDSINDIEITIGDQSLYVSHLGVIDMFTRGGSITVI